MSTSTHDALPINQQPVGDLLALELKELSWSQADFAAVLGRPTQFVSEIITGNKEITRESAAQIAAALGHTAQYWLNLQNQYLLAEQAGNQRTQTKLEDVRRRARLNMKAPIALLKKRGVLTGSTIDALETEVQELFGLASLDDEPYIAMAAKRANHNEDVSLLQKTWGACVGREGSRDLPKVPYAADKLARIAADLPRRVHTEGDFAKLPAIFAEAGVRLVFVEAFAGAKIDGCSMFVGQHPVIGLSGRGQRLDKVFFTLLHEVGHILRGHVTKDCAIIEDLDDKDPRLADRETEANGDAVNWIFPRGFPKVPARISGPWVEETANQLGIARILLVGQLQKRGRLDWRTTLAKGAPTVTEALTSW